MTQPDNSASGTLQVDGDPVEFRSDEPLLVTLLRNGLHPTGGGCLCLGGDCGHCLATVDGVAYTRTCQLTSREGLVVEREHLAGAEPRLLRDDGPAVDEATRPARHEFCDVVVIGQGAAGRQAADSLRNEGHQVVALDARDGQDVVGIYPGPLVVARTASETLQVHADRIVVATGAAEIQPIAPGAELEGLVTSRGATILARHDVELGRVIAIGEPPEGVDAQQVSGSVAHFEGEGGKLRAVVLDATDGGQERYECDTVSVGLGLTPRDALLRMGREQGVEGVGECTLEPTLPPAPTDGVVCPCSGTTVEDLEQAWERGFRELELIKRSTLAGTGTCQGSTCLPHLRSFLASKGGELQPPFTARPLTRQATVAEIAAGAHDHPTAQTALDGEHRALGALMERSGGWWRPWTYGDTDGEMRAVRDAVSLGDVSTLGKFIVQGRDALRALELLYPTKVSTIKVGRSRYALLLDERGYVLDDGMISREAEDRFHLSLTSGGATFGEAWIRDWLDSLGPEADVRVLNQTQSLGAINVTGPQAAELLARAGVPALPAFAAHVEADVAGVACQIFRLSFTGELSYELHHASADSVALWRRLLELGEDLGIRPHGLDALLRLRLEKGHIVVGKDTDYDSTPRRIHHEWAVRREKDDFVGKQAVLRTDLVPLNRQLVGFEMALPGPTDGATIRLRDEGDVVGYVTSATSSKTLDKAVGLAWVDLQDGELPNDLFIDGRPARRADPPFYDAESARSRAKVEVSPAEPREWPPVTISPPEPLERLEGVRVLAASAQLDAFDAPGESLVLRLAPDEAFVLNAEVGELESSFDVAERETGFVGCWLSCSRVEAFFARESSWRLPAQRPSLSQGAVAGLPVKVWLEDERALVLSPAPYAGDLAQRLREVLA